MQNYIVRQPILDNKQNVVAYEIVYQQDASSLYNESDSNVANAIENFLTQMDSEKFLSGKIAYFTFTPNLLLRNIPKIFPAQKLVIQIEDNCIVHPLAQKVIYRYKKQGYKIAVKGFEFSPRYFGILDVIDIIKIDFNNYKNESYPNIIDMAKNLNKEIVAYNVNSQAAYEMVKKLGCKFLQGTCVAEQSTSKVHRIDHMQSNFFQLMVSITKEEPDIDEIANIISRDVTLAFSLMKLVNSAYFALRNRARSVKQALIVLGLGQLKQWIYLLSFKQDKSSVPDEVIRISFLRANFCSELSAYARGMNISKTEAYMLGMFSTLGLIMEVPLETALGELPINQDIKNALLTGEGPSGALFGLVLAYEQANWNAITEYAQQLEIPIQIISQKYFECIEYVNTIWYDLMHPFDAEPEAAKQHESVLK